MKRELVLAIGVLILGMPTITPAHTGNSSVANESSVQFAAAMDGVIQFGNRGNNQIKNEGMTLVFDDDLGKADDDAGANDVSNSGPGFTDDTDVNSVVEFKKMLPLPESMAGGLSDTGSVRGVQPGGRAWKLTSAEGKLKEDGELKVHVEGLLLEGEDMNTSSSSFRALVSCVGEAGETTFMTPDFPVDELGNAQIEHRFDDMGLCIAPTVFVGSGSEASVDAEDMNDLSTSDFRWFAVTGHSFSGAVSAADDSRDAAPAADDSSDASPIAAGGGVVSDGVPPLSDVFSGTPTTPADANQPATGIVLNPTANTPPAAGAAPASETPVNAAGTASVPPVAGTSSTTAPTTAGTTPLDSVALERRPANPTTAAPGLAPPPIAGTGSVGAFPPASAPSPLITAPSTITAPSPLITAPSVAAPSPIITAPPAITAPSPIIAAPSVTATSPFIGPPDAGTFSAPGPFDDTFPSSTFDDPIPAPGFTTAPGFPLGSGAFNDPAPFRFGGNFTDLALASPVF